MKMKIMMSVVAVAVSMNTGCTKGCKTNQEQAPASEGTNEGAAKEGAGHAEGAPAEGGAATPEGAGGEDGEPEKKTTEDKLKSEFNLNAGDKLIAEFNTNMGVIKAELAWDKAPRTVLNFAELAMGKKEWLDAKTQTKVTKPLYDGTVFHRVIKGFMIQGGDPLGTGIGGPGYNFKDEFDPSLKHDKKGILSMANAGPNTNGSQFFITEGPTPHLDNRHSVFGQVSDPASLEVITKIAAVETDASDKPKTPIVVNSVKIIKG